MIIGFFNNIFRFDKLWKIILATVVLTMSIYVCIDLYFNFKKEGYVAAFIMALIISYTFGLSMLSINKKLVEMIDKNKAQANLLRRENNLKTRLLSVLSHDVRTPLNSLSNLLDLYDSNDINANSFLSFKEKLRKQLDDTQTTVTTTLEWIKHQNKNVIINSKSVDLRKALEEIYRSNKTQIASKKINLSMNFEHSGDPFVDATMFKVIVQNILSNAVKHSQERGDITIQTSNLNEWVTITITDQGRGMTKEKIRSITSREVSSNSLQYKEELNLGLGIDTCLALLDLNLGKLNIYSAVGAGSTFEVLLPAAK